MKINLNLLPVKIDCNVDIPKSYYERTSIKDLLDVHAFGEIKTNAIDEVVINLDVTGTMVLTDAVTNDPINHEFAIKIDEVLEDLDGENEKYFEKNQNILDIIEFLWENIVLEVPMRLTKAKNAHLKGNGWELNNNDSLDDIDPRMEKLSDIFKGGE